MDISPRDNSRTPSKRASGWGIKIDVEGIKVVSADGQESAPVKELKSSQSVVDATGQQWDLDGGVREDLSHGTPKKLLSQFSAGFPKTWARGASQVRKALQLKHDLKEVSWLDLPFVGIEFNSIPAIRAEPYAFPHLLRELREGVMADRPYPIYLFQCAQPCWNDATKSMKQVPYIVAIDCAVAPPDKLAYHSVQLAAHDIIDMKSLPAYARYEWTPYVPKSVSVELDKLPIQCYVLGWAGRNSQFSNLGEASVHYIEYLHPYILLPQVVEKTPAPIVSSVDFEWSHGDKKYQIVFDKEIDRLATFIPEFLEDNELVGVVAEEVVKEALQTAFKEKRAKEEAKHKTMLDTVAAMSAETQQALRNMKAYKFYPYHPDMDTAAFADDSINQYFGRATQVFLPTAADAALMREMQQQNEEQGGNGGAAEEANEPEPNGTPAKRARAPEAAEPEEEGATTAKAAKVDPAQ